jgi:hypothetical protein
MQDLIELQKKLITDFEYKDGGLYWRENKCRRNMSKPAGNPHKNYLSLNYKNHTYTVHRLIFLYHHGYLPPILDHIDGNPMNNRIENLRPATKNQNGYNMKIRSNNTTGYKGVYWRNREQRYLAACSVEGKKIELGYFKILEDAVKAVKEFREKHHGEFARHE